MSDGGSTLSFARDRVTALLDRLEGMAAGDARAKVPISPLHDELDAIGFGINVLADELRWVSARAAETERRATEELRASKEKAERANESKTVFLRTASHEIRAPIAAILGITDMLAIGGLTDDDQADLVERLRANCRALLSLVGNVLDLSRLEADKLTLTLEPVSPLELIREVVSSLEPEARKRRLDVRVEHEGAAAVVVETDRLRLRQILVNLVANALKFTAQGQVCVSLAAAQREGNTELAIDVSDTGIGIDPDRVPSLFEPFGQVSASFTRNHGGSGLGLALSRRLAEQLGGALTLLHSEPGRGSTFRLALTAPIVELTPAAISLARRERPNGVLHGVRVLLAEDHADLRLAIGRVLQLEGATIDFARDGSEAVSMVRGGGFDVVLMDVNMPVVNGLDATRALRVEGCQLPIVALSADASAESRTESIDAGCSSFLSKPFDADDLVASIRFLRSGGKDTARQ